MFKKTYLLFFSITFLLSSCDDGENSENKDYSDFDLNESMDAGEDVSFEFCSETAYNGVEIIHSGNDDIYIDAISLVDCSSGVEFFVSDTYGNVNVQDIGNIKGIVDFDCESKSGLSRVGKDSLFVVDFGMRKIRNDSIINVYTVNPDDCSRGSIQNISIYLIGNSPYKCSLEETMNHFEVKNCELSSVSP